MRRWNIQNIDIYYTEGKAHCWHRLLKMIGTRSKWILISLEIGTGHHHVEKGNVSGPTKWTKIFTATERSRRYWWVMRKPEYRAE